MLVDVESHVRQRDPGEHLRGGVRAGLPGLPPQLGARAHRLEARVVAEVKVDMPAEGPVLLKDRPAAAAGGAVVVESVPGELGAGAPIAAHPGASQLTPPPR